MTRSKHANTFNSILPSNSWLVPIGRFEQQKDAGSFLSQIHSHTRKIIMHTRVFLPYPLRQEARRRPVRHAEHDQGECAPQGPHARPDRQGVPYLQRVLHARQAGESLAAVYAGLEAGVLRSSAAGLSKGVLPCLVQSSFHLCLAISSWQGKCGNKAF